jgi:hypothetical protein
MPTAFTSDSKLFRPPQLLLGGCYPVRDVFPSKHAPLGVVRREYRWCNEATGELLEPFARYLGGPNRAPSAGEFYISGALPEGYYASNDYIETRFPIGELVFVSRRTIEIITPFEPS